MKRVLVIDDEEGIRTLLRAVLERDGYQVTVAGGGREGVRLHRERPFDLVITDLFMDEGDGIEAILELQTAGAGPPVIAISGGSPRLGLDSLAVARRLGAAAVLRKPFRSAEILAEVRTLLAAGSAAP
jgi:DNA-binding response OmpR family regulator